MLRSALAGQCVFYVGTEFHSIRKSTLSFESAAAGHRPPFMGRWCASFCRYATLQVRTDQCSSETAAQHHDLLVRRFIERPVAELYVAELQGITASGPPLPVLLRSLEILRDQRIAAKRSDLVTRHEDFAKLRNLLTE
jgi:hypothetical protein